jgi:hypothetical protein
VGIGAVMTKNHEKTADRCADDPLDDELSPTRSEGAREQRTGEGQAAANRRDEPPA